MEETQSRDFKFVPSHSLYTISFCITLLITTLISIWAVPENRTRAPEWLRQMACIWRPMDGMKNHNCKLLPPWYNANLTDSLYASCHRYTSQGSLRNPSVVNQISVHVFEDAKPRYKLRQSQVNSDPTDQCLARRYLKTHDARRKAMPTVRQHIRERVSYPRLSNLIAASQGRSRPMMNLETTVRETRWTNSEGLTCQSTRGTSHTPPPVPPAPNPEPIVGNPGGSKSFT